jgi:hypothetical protein
LGAGIQAVLGEYDARAERESVFAPSATLKLEIGCRMLGQPVPDSNLVRESNSVVSQPMQW